MAAPQEHTRSEVHRHLLTERFVLHLSAVHVSPLLLLQQMLQPFELVDVERLQPDELLSGDQRHLLCCVHSCVSLRGQVTVTTCSDWAPPSDTRLHSFTRQVLLGLKQLGPSVCVELAWKFPLSLWLKC